MKKIIFLALLLISVSFAQHDRQGKYSRLFGKPAYFSEVLTFPDGGNYNITYAYRIPYNQLFFTKDNDVYRAGASIMVEVYDNNGMVAARDIKENKVSVNKFSDTNSGDMFLQGIISFNLPDSQYDLKPTFTDLNSGNTFRPEHHHIEKYNTGSAGLLNPVVVNKSYVNNESGKTPVLTNFNGFVPFDEKNYQLIFPCADTSVRKIYVTLTNHKETIKKELTGSYLSSDSIVDYKGNILLENDNGRLYRNFVLNDFSSRLREGELKITVSKNEDDKTAANYLKHVVWLDKPLSLRNPEYAIKFLKYMVGDSVVSGLLDADNDAYPDELFSFWKKYDPTPATAFNELMSEYYKRVDFALKNFGTITGVSGAETDRGRIFIKFGKPSEIKRSSDDYGRVVETWSYEKEKLNFVFVDKNGTGEFPLVKG